MRIAPALILLLLSAPAAAKEADVLATVDGVPIRREAVAARVWSLHANDALNQMVDEIVAERATEAFRKKASKKDREAWDKEAETRLGQVKSQFKGEADFAESLAKSGLTLDAVKRQIETQVLRERMVIAAKGLETTAAEAKEFYEANKERMGTPESVRLRHILVAGEQQAKDLLVAVKVGADFAKLAEEISLDGGSRPRGGDLGFISRGMLQPEIEKVAFSLRPGEVSDVVRTQMGIHLFKAEERRQGQPARFSEVEKDLMRALLAQKISRAWPVYLQELRAAAKVAPAAGVTMAPPSGAGPR